MFNRPKKLSGIGNAVFESLSFGGIPPETCPDAGILLRTVDTSRNELDFAGNSFLIPYSTSFFTNGSCGETSVETWGLEYLPAGWVTNTGTDDIGVDWNYTTSDLQNITGYAAISWQAWQDREDGTGINYRVNVMGGDYVPDGATLDSYNDGNSVRWRVTRSGNGTSFADYTMYPTYGTFIEVTYDDQLIYIAETDTNERAGEAQNDNFADGYGGVYKITTYVSWMQNGEVIVVISTTNSQSYDSNNDTNYDNGQYTQYVAKANGSGSYFTDSIIAGSYFDYGVVVYNHTDVPNTSSWEGYSFNNGTSEKVDRIWDGTGNFTYSSTYTAGEYYPQYTSVAEGDFYDMNGSGPYSLYWNGDGTIGSTYNGGGGCDSEGTSYGIQCTYTEGSDASGSDYTGYWTAQDAYADGSCGTIYYYVGVNQDGCYYPYGWWTNYNDNPSYSTWYVYDSDSNLVAYDSFTWASYGDGNYADGSGGSISTSWNSQLSYADQIYSGEFFDNSSGMQLYYVVYSDGFDGYFVNITS
jgi:hypothetical protein